MQYNPFIHLHPYHAVTQNLTVARIENVVSSPSLSLESATLILSYGLDCYFTRYSPSKGFDMLSSEFNRVSLTLILGGMAIIVLILRNMYRKKQLTKAWA